MRKIFFAAFVILLLSPTSNVLAAFGYDPFLDWQTLQTENFNIHFHDGSEELARRVAQTAERAHARLAPYFQWVPTQRTEVIVNDRVDFSNGAATPIYYNTMFLYVTPPDDANTLEDFDDWLNLLITHEYTHILHLDKSTRAAGVFRKIFGRAPVLPVLWPIFPNAFQPAFYTEGLATYIETDKDKGIGRGQSSMFEMMMRMELLDDGFKTLRNINQPITTWPAGTARYLYGVYFFEYIADTYGAEKIPQWVDKFSGHIIPYALNHTSKRVLGQDLDDVWAGFETYVKKKFDPQIEAVRKQGIVEGEQLTDDGYYTGHPTVMANGDIYYVQDDFRDESALMLIKAGTKKATRITGVHGNRFDAHEDAGLLLAQLEIVSNTEIYSDLYHIDLKDYDVTRLTHGGRYRAATWSPDGKQIIAVHNEAGNTSLHLLDSNGKLLDTLWQGKNMEVIGELDWSPDGSQVVAPVWRPENRWDLELFDVHSKTWSKLTNTDDIEMHPRYFDKDKIVFSADYGGIYNIQVMDMNTRKTRSLTNVIGGAFNPVINGNTLVYTGFTSKGYDVYRLNLNGTKKSPVTHTAAGKKDYDYEAWQSQAMPVYSITPYSPWHTLTPRWWFPILYFSDYQKGVGVMTASSDALNRHNYYIAPIYDFENKWHEGSFAYIYDRWNPALRLQADRSSSVDLNDNDELERVTIHDSASAELIFPLLDLDYQWGLHTAVIYDKEKDGRLGEILPDTPAPSKPAKEDTLSGAAITFNSAKSFPISVSLNRGRRFKLVAEDSDFAGGDYTGQVYSGEWQEYIALGGQHVLAMRLAGGHGTESPRPFELGGYLGEDYGHPIMQGPGQLFNKREYSLRGYPDGLPGLRGRKMALGALEYRFPIMRIERGVTAPPIGIHQMHAMVFMEAGEAWNSEADRDPLRSSAGFEYHVEFILGYAALLDLRLGAAYGFNRDGEAQIYAGVGSSF